jgi:DNA-binding GntR family transcriptional regulator
MSIKASILRELRNAIARGEYRPGEHLTESSLSRRFNVSRTPVREALNQLEKEGFIKITPDVGAKVVELSLKDISDIYDMLIALEGLASRLATMQLTNEKIRKLEEYHVMMVKAAGERNLELIFELNIQFHWLITEATNNPYLIEVRTNLRKLVDRFASISHLIPGQYEATLTEHRKIIDAFKGQNPALADFSNREHLEGAKKRLLDYLREKQERGEEGP